MQQQVKTTHEIHAIVGLRGYPLASCESISGMHHGPPCQDARDVRISRRAIALITQIYFNYGHIHSHCLPSIHHDTRQRHRGHQPRIHLQRELGQQQQGRAQQSCGHVHQSVVPPLATATRHGRTFRQLVTSVADALQRGQDYH